jgi:hypothetical protein
MGGANSNDRPGHSVQSVNYMYSVYSAVQDKVARKRAINEKNLREKRFKDMRAEFSWAGPGGAPHLPRDSAHAQQALVLY